MPSSTDENPLHKAGRVLKRRIANFCAEIAVVVGILVAQAVIKERDAAFDRARTEAANPSAGFEEGVRGILNGVTGASEFLKDHIEEQEAKGEAFNPAAWKSKGPDLVSPTIDIFVIDADAKLRATTFAHDSKTVFYSDREYFLMHRDNSRLRLLIGHPIYGKLEKRMVIPVSRRLNTPDGRFAGVLIFTIEPRLLTALYRNVDLGKTGALNLFFNDGIVFARYTSETGFDASLVGRKINGLQALTEAAHGDAGAFVKSSAIEGTRRIYSWRKVAGVS